MSSNGKVQKQENLVEDEMTVLRKKLRKKIEMERNEPDYTRQEKLKKICKTTGATHSQTS